MQKTFFYQDYSMYGEEDHKTWSILLQRQRQLYDNGRASKEYLRGLENLRLDKNRIVKINEVSALLKELAGWTLVAVKGLIPVRDFFYLICDRKYPITVYIRKPDEIDFSEQPDIFHDVCGHLPLLTQKDFVRFLISYSAIALKYVDNDRAVDLLGRLYWFTYEVGLIKENGVNRAYGGAILTSTGEMENIKNENIPIYPFDIDQIFRTPYDSFRLQHEYFIIDSFDDLFKCLANLEAKLKKHLETSTAK